MTVSQILTKVVPHRDMSVRTLYSHISALKVKPVGTARQRPQQYPDDTPDRILKRLGLTPKKGGAK
jgi:hypothetical protein